MSDPATVSDDQPTRVRLAVAQLELDHLDDDARHRTLLDAIAEAAAGGADLVVLPELAACGYLLDAEHLAARAEPGDASGPVLGGWADAAWEHGVAVVGGFAEQGVDGMYNAAVLIDRTGTVRLRYRKLHLFGPEHDVFLPGDLGLPVVALGGLTVGILICYDLRFPEAPRTLALAGADVIAVPTAWVGGFDRPDRDPARPIGQIEAALVHANLNQVVLACADQVGRTPAHEFLGRSVIVDPYGDPVVGPLPADGQAVVWFDLDPDLTRRARERGPGISPRANRRPDVYGLPVDHAAHRGAS